MRYILNKYMKLFLALILFISAFSVYAQSISRPTFVFTNACASISSNEYDVFSSYTNGSGVDQQFSSDTIFYLELSNVDGDFDFDTEIIASVAIDLSDPAIEFIDFAMPITVGSNNYRFRIYASELDVVSSNSNTFGSYYYDGSRYFLEPRCLSGSGTFTTTPDNLETYLWYKDDVLIEGENSNTIEVSEEGEYFYEPDLGNCNLNHLIKSNISYVIASEGTEISINGATSYSVCSDETVTLTSSINETNFFYNWFKDDVELVDVSTADFQVSGSNTYELTVSGIDMDGEYRVEMATSILAACADQSEDVTITLLNPDIEITSSLEVLILSSDDGTTLTAEVLSGTNPVITWFKDDVAISDSNTTSLTVFEEGVYTASVTADSECDTNNTVYADDEITVLVPDSVAITIDYEDDNYEDCDLDEVIIYLSSMEATSGGDTITIEGDDLLDINVSWFNGGALYSSVASNEITITSASDNGTYSAQIDFDGTIYTSNELSVLLALESFEITKDKEFLVADDTIELSLDLTDTSDYTFQWYLNNTTPITGETSQTLTVDAVGLYSVQVTSANCGTTQTIGPIAINSGVSKVPNVISPNGDGINDDWVLPSEYSGVDSVTIEVYTSEGKLDFTGNSYDGEWPTNSESQLNGAVYYYIISDNGNVKENGSITIIR